MRSNGDHPNRGTALRVPGRVGPAAGLLHGMGESSIGWRPVLDRLSAEFDVLAIDLPGFDGPRPCPAGRHRPWPPGRGYGQVTEPAEM